MMVSPISSVRFCGEAKVLDLAREGAHAKQAAPVPEAEKQKSGTGKKVLNTVIGLVVAAGVLAALPKVFPKAIKTLDAETLKDAKFMNKIGHYLAKAGEFIGKYTYKPIVRLFKKSPKAETEPPKVE